MSGNASNCSDKTAKNRHSSKTAEPCPEIHTACLHGPSAQHRQREQWRHSGKAEERPNTPMPC